MIKKSIVHIHTDSKFIDADTDRFLGEYFENRIVYFGRASSYKGKYHDIISFRDRGDIEIVLEWIRKSDLLILYNLCGFKRYIASQVFGEVFIAWRFFGAELYKHMPKLVYTKATRNLLWPLWWQYKLWIKGCLRSIRDKYIPKKDYSFVSLDAGMAYVDYILMLSHEEHEYLKDYWGDKIPKLIKLSHFKASGDLQEFDINCKNLLDRSLIIVGNNRSAYNNHIDVISIIERLDNIGDFNFKLLFNYGTITAYSEKLERRVKHIQSLDLIDRFMSPVEFDKFYYDVTALVINGRRQMAAANIFTAIGYGVKVYLNKKNSLFSWLINEGFFVYDIESLEDDLKNRNVKLNELTIENNIKNLISFSERYTPQDFQNVIYNCLI